jgi:hypothetical protein
VPELRPAVGVGRTITATALLNHLRYRAPAQSKITLRVEAADLRYCKVAQGRIKGVKRGSCRVVIRVKPPGSPPVVKRVRLYVN